MNIRIGGIDFEVVEGEQIDCITWEELTKKMPIALLMRFKKFMEHQTQCERGVYVCDVQNFARPQSKQYFD